MHLNSRPSLKRIIPGTYPGLASPCRHGYPSGSHLKVLGQNLLVGIQTSAFPELQTLGLSGVIRGEVSKCFQVLLVLGGPPSIQEHPGGSGQRHRGSRAGPFPKLFRIPFVGSWVGKQQPEQLCCSLALRAPTVQPVPLSPRDAPGCSGKEHKPSTVSVGAHKPSSGAELRVTTDRSPQGMFLGTSINEQRSKFLVGPGSAARASRTWCSGVMWLQWKMTPSFPKIISLVVMAQRIQQGLCWGAECRPCCRGQTQHGIN